MRARSILIVALFTLVGMALFAPWASAQSAITGVVKDSTGLVMPGATVEAASPALIERIRTVSSDAQGRYTIVDLRPGVYKVTFSLAGFRTVILENINLPANFSATLNAELELGAVEESVTVSGLAPTVDVQNAQRTTVINRELLDAVPMPRMFVAQAAMAVGTKVSSQNVGGTRAAVNPRVTAHGSLSKDTTIDVDSMKMNTLVGGGDSHPDHNDGMTQEMTVQTSALGAEVSAGGPHINLIPRSGGNVLSGATYVGYSNGAMQFDNLTADLLAQGLQTPDAVDLVYDVNASAGGPIKKDKLWLFGSYRNVGNDNIVANSFYPDGSPGIYDQRVHNYTARLTWQVNASNKFTIYDDYQTKYVGHLFSSGIDVATASRRRPPVIKYTAAAKWTSNFGSRLLVDAGYGTSVNSYTEKYQPGIEKVPFTPEWYSNAARIDITRGTTTTASTPQTGTYNFRYMLIGSAAYVTGSHALKTGVQWHIGQTWNTADANADLVQRYRDGVPDSVIVYNTPTRTYNLMGADFGIYIQDSWTLNRLTINPGLRWEHFNSSVQPMSVEGGRFVPLRTFGEIQNVPDWNNIAPRFSAVYNLTGDAKTAVKFGVNKFNRNFTTDFANRYSATVLQSDTRNWSDCDFVRGTSTCSPQNLPTNRDGIAQDNEIGPSNNNNFGLAPARHPDPDLKRVYDLEYTVAIDRQIFSGVSLTGAWYRRDTHDMEQQINTLVTVDDYSSFQVPNPISGEPVTIYNLNRSKQGQVDLLDMTGEYDVSRANYTGFEVSFAARLPKGGNLFGGWSADHTISVACGGNDPNTFRYCDQSELDIPFRHDFKFNGSYPLPWAMSVGVTVQSYAGASLAANWTVPANVFPTPPGRTQAVIVNLIPPGSQYLDRWNEMDMSVHKRIRIGRYDIDTALDIYNLLNSNVVLQQNQNYGSSLGQPQQILQGRLLRISNQIKF